MPRGSPCEWDQADDTAEAIILLALDDNQAILVVHLKTAKEVWDRLELAHRQSSRVGRVAIQRQFYAANMKKGETVISYISRLQQIFTQLLESGVKIDEGTESQFKKQESGAAVTFVNNSKGGCGVSFGVYEG